MHEVSKRFLKSHLDAFFFEIYFHGQLFAEEYIWVMRLVECFLQFLKLLLGEDCAMASFPFLAGAKEIVMWHKAGRERIVGSCNKIQNKITTSI